MSLYSGSISSLLSSTVLSHTALAISTLVIGYWLGVGRSLFAYNSSLKKRYDQLGADSDSDLDLRDSDSEDQGEGEGEDGEKMNALKRGLGKLSGGEECKMVLCVRMDLKMDKGKMAAQCCHATLACYQSLLSSNPRLLKQWQRLGQAKVALKCPNEEEMDKLAAHARSLGLTAKSIRDAGRTQVAAGSRTVLGIGPGPIKIVDQVTAHLKLL